AGARREGGRGPGEDDRRRRPAGGGAAPGDPTRARCVRRAGESRPDRAVRAGGRQAGHLETADGRTARRPLSDEAPARSDSGPTRTPRGGLGGPVHRESTPAAGDAPDAGPGAGPEGHQAGANVHDAPPAVDPEAATIEALAKLGPGATRGEVLSATLRLTSLFRDPGARAF